jgi:hypothetical protein
MPEPGLDIGRALFIMILIGVTIGIAVLLNAPLPFPGGGVNGTLTGPVSIGPLCPLEPCTMSPEQLAAIFAARTVTVRSPAGDLIAAQHPDPLTGYSISLRPGVYRVDIVPGGMHVSPDLPKSVTIRPGETVRVDITIDTGIR